MEEQLELRIAENERLALERERRRLARTLARKGLITREALERMEAEPHVLAHQHEAV
ncbi:MAG: hypothetical protein QOG16_1408 [Actinomycetota bacterium]|jgi:hypothetical protein|nr:hypothetical protein [Actinomycetota bacterium]